MSYYIYVLKSEKASRFYIGATENIEQRLKKHNRGGVKSTRSYKPWQIIYTEEFHTNGEARKRENHLKKNYQARKAIFKK